MFNLEELPHDHPLRNRPLKGAELRYKNGKRWRKLSPTSYVAMNCCYNDLSGSWIQCCEWRFPASFCD